MTSEPAALPIVVSAADSSDAVALVEGAETVVEHVDEVEIVEPQATNGSVASLGGSHEEQATVHLAGRLALDRRVVDAEPAQAVASRASCRCRLGAGSDG